MLKKYKKIQENINLLEDLKIYIIHKISVSLKIS